MVRASTVFVASILLLSACSGNGPSTTTDAIASGLITISNHGGTLEGHTPTAFPGMGTGLFAGDNLNRSFPEGVGVHLYLTFALPSELSVGEAQIISDALHVSGTPFEDLGPLVIEPVTYQTFGPDLFDLEAIGAHTECTVVGDTSITCDVTPALRDAVERGAVTAQFRIRFTHPADSDGNQDLAMFFRADSNSNEPGIFELAITPNT